MTASGPEELAIAGPSRQGLRRISSFPLIKGAVPAGGGDPAAITAAGAALPSGGIRKGGEVRATLIEQLRARTREGEEAARKRREPHPRQATRRENDIGVLSILLADLKAKMELMAAEMADLREEVRALRSQRPAPHSQQLPNAPNLPAATRPVERKQTAPVGSCGKKKKKKKGGKGVAPSLPPPPKTGQYGPGGRGQPTRGGVRKAAQPPREKEAAPPRPATQVETWSQVVGRRSKRATKNGPKGGSARKPQSGGKATAPQKRKAPGSAAITVTCPTGRYAEVMAEARRTICLADLGIHSMRVRRALTGALIFEIPGAESGAAEEGRSTGAAASSAASKADALAERMRGLFAAVDGPAVQIARPKKLAELRVRDLDDATTTVEVVEAVARAGGCGPTEVKVGPLKNAPNGLQTAWVRCPLRAANKIIAARRLLVGWASVRVDMLPTRTLQCFRCLERGHVRSTCGSDRDRSDRCYRCGEPGHRAQTCSAQPRCPVCSDAGRPAGHRAGSAACTAPLRKGVTPKSGAGGETATPAPPSQLPRRESKRRDRRTADAGSAEIARGASGDAGNQSASPKQKKRRTGEVLAEDLPPRVEAPSDQDIVMADLEGVGAI